MISIPVSLCQGPASLFTEFPIVIEDQLLILLKLNLSVLWNNFIPSCPSRVVTLVTLALFIWELVGNQRIFQFNGIQCGALILPQGLRKLKRKEKNWNCHWDN